MRHRVLLIVVTALTWAGCGVAEAERLGDDRFPLDYHPLFPQYGPSNGQIAAGVATGTALEQPIGFSHLLHAGQLQMNCQYCHSEARKSLHSGVPPVQVCMGCHQHIRKDSPEVQKIHEHWCGKKDCVVARDAFGQPVRDVAGKPIPWNKVHDLPDYVHFAHSRHIGIGLDCTECHGQVQLQGEYELMPIPGGAADAVYRQVDEVMVRETSLQMGWCIDCHATHPAVDEKYGEKAALRRAELKDCWTCHK